ncbi:MAG TPA: cytochrome P450, partial [Alphaproteobacteria bacterium]|nr:cytochrome P450 [Alphaproteobacteria bacterium]
YPKPASYIRALRPVLGGGLLISEGRIWRENRRLAAPLFRPSRMPRYYDRMGGWIAAERDAWHNAAAADRRVDLQESMTRIALNIICAAMFGIDASDRIPVISACMEQIQADLGRFRISSMLPLPKWLPLVPDRATRAAIRELDSVVTAVIAGRRTESAAPRHDFLEVLMQASDPESGRRFTDRQLRDEIMTILLAGHETSATALTWTFVLLARHPEVQEAFAAEARAAFGGSAPDYHALQAFTGARNLFKEALRLYPPGYNFTRVALKDDVLGGCRIPAGSIVNVTPYLIHRNPVHWPDPLRFRPDRFAAAGDLKTRYFPFGGGPRVCIGNSFAAQEAELILATLCQAFRVEGVEGPLTSSPAITLRPAFDTRARIVARVADAKAALGSPFTMA